MKHSFKRLLSFCSALLLMMNVIIPTGAFAATQTIGGKPVDTAYPYGASISFGRESVTIPSGVYIVLDFVKYLVYNHTRLSLAGLL